MNVAGISITAVDLPIAAMNADRTRALVAMDT